LLVMPLGALSAAVSDGERLAVGEAGHAARRP
jgi:hypothetical protein